MLHASWGSVSETSLKQLPVSKLSVDQIKLMADASELDVEQIKRVHDMREYDRAIAVCLKTGFTKAAPSPETMGEYKALFSNAGLVRALATMHAVLNKLNNPEKILLNIKTLFNAASKENAKSLDAANTRFFLTNRVQGGILSSTLEAILESYKMDVDGDLRWKLGFDK